MFGINRLQNQVNFLEKMLKSFRETYDGRIHKLEWRLENPPKYKVGDTHKCLGKCFYIDIKAYGICSFEYEYRFSKDDEVIIVNG